MLVIHAAQTAAHDMHGTSFVSYASPARGSRELCAWRVEIPGHTQGVPHHVTREEVLYVLGGTVRVTVDGQPEEASAGDVILVPAGARFGVDNLTDQPVTAWVTTSVGFAGVLPDGSWTSSSAATAVTGRVIEVMRKIASGRIGSRPPTAAVPTASMCTSPPRASPSTSPGTRPAVTWPAITSCSRSSPGLDKPAPPMAAVLSPLLRSFSRHTTDGPAAQDSPQ
jgi:quercetin dioxygenase-like cupin family protein